MFFSILPKQPLNTKGHVLWTLVCKWMTSLESCTLIIPSTSCRIMALSFSHTYMLNRHRHPLITIEVVKPGLWMNDFIEILLLIHAFNIVQNYVVPTAFHIIKRILWSRNDFKSKLIHANRWLYKEPYRDNAHICKSVFIFFLLLLFFLVWYLFVVLFCPHSLYIRLTNGERYRFV